MDHSLCFGCWNIMHKIIIFQANSHRIPVKNEEREIINWKVDLYINKFDRNVSECFFINYDFVVNSIYLNFDVY